MRQYFQNLRDRCDHRPVPEIVAERGNPTGDRRLQRGDERGHREISWWRRIGRTARRCRRRRWMGGRLRRRRRRRFWRSGRRRGSGRCRRLGGRGADTGVTWPVAELVSLVVAVCAAVGLTGFGAGGSCAGRRDGGGRCAGARRVGARHLRFEIGAAACRLVSGRGGGVGAPSVDRRAFAGRQPSRPTRGRPSARRSSSRRPG